MYRKSSKGWLKHGDFIILDLICLQLAFILAYWIRKGFEFPYETSLYRNMAIVIELINVMVIFFMEPFKNVLKRGYYKEFVSALKQTFIVALFSVMYLFTNKEAQNFSRIILYLGAFLYLLLTYVVRIIWKRVLMTLPIGRENKSVLIVTSRRCAEEVIKNVRDHKYSIYGVDGLVIADEDMTGQKIAGISVVANCENAAAYVCREWIDEVFVILAPEHAYPQKMINEFVETGVTVHINLEKISAGVSAKQLVEKIGNYTMLTTSMNYAPASDLILKRLMDIAGGLAGCILTAIIFLFIGPAIYISSPGPIFFSQMRVGKNGKKFKMYKFRSMYMDAEERKKELMKDNRVADGMMFKLDFDPRIIGNKILPDGTKKTGLGNFIRVTSLDEFPQFLNVLKGDMSLVGTRPPTLDEWDKYELHHRARLAIKPGITGMWQVSGRSEITDFEEVVKLDTQYINEWSLGKDIKILLMTVMAVFKREGSM